MRSIIQPFGWEHCYLCGRPATDVHHIFGAALRNKSEFYGLTVHLCRNCHTEGPDSVHKNREVDLELRREAERALLFNQGWTVEEFRDTFRKNYLDEDELPVEEKEIRDPQVPDHLKKFI